MSNQATLARTADLYPFTGTAMMEAHARELQRVLRPRVDPRAETVRLISSKRKAG